MASGVAFGQKIFKWTDSNGVVHYSSQPIETADEFKVSQHAPELPPVEKEPEPDEVEPEPRVEPEEEEQAGPSKRELAKLRAARCEQGRKLVEQIEPRSRLALKGADGEVRELSDQERLDRLAQAKTLVADNC